MCRNAKTKTAEVSRLRGDDGVIGQCGKFEFNALVDGEPMKTLKDGREMGAMKKNVTSQQQPST